MRVMQLAKRLRQLVGQHQLTIPELSRHTGVPVNTLHNWLSGQAPRKLEQVKQVAEFFNVTLDDLIFGQEIRIEPTKLPELLMTGQYEIVIRPTTRRREPDASGAVGGKAEPSKERK